MTRFVTLAAIVALAILAAAAAAGCAGDDSPWNDRGDLARVGEPTPTPSAEPLDPEATDEWGLRTGSTYPHTVDGAFTDWKSGQYEYEWFDVPALPGRFTNLYVDYVGGELHILNDWHYNEDGETDPDCYNEFDFGWSGGTLKIRVYGDQTSRVWIDGEEVDAVPTKGGYSFGRSPMVPDRDHTMWELSIEVPAGEDWVCRLKDPPPSQNSCEDLATEETILEGTTTWSGLEIRGSTRPVVLDGWPREADPGAAVSLRVGNADDGVTAFFDGQPVALAPTDDPEVFGFTVPTVPPGAYDVRVRGPVGAWSLPLVLDVGGDPDDWDVDGDGVSVNEGDCDEGDPDVYPGQAAFFLNPRDDGSYDYDCDGVEELEAEPFAQCGSWPGCGGDGTGWCVDDCPPCEPCADPGTVPACGEPGLWTAGSCSYEPERNVCLLAGDTTVRNQRCR